MRSTHYQSDKPERHHLTPMRDPTGYLDEGKGLPWITMDYLVHVLRLVENTLEPRKSLGAMEISTDKTNMKEVDVTHIELGMFVWYTKHLLKAKKVSLK